MDTTQMLAIRNKIIGVLVRRARLQAGLTQAQCAEALGCSAYMFGQYEQGAKGVSLPQLEALACLFDVPLPSLWDAEFEPPGESRTTDTLPLDQMLLLRQKMIAIQVRQAREAVGLTQAGLARRLGCSPDMISQYEQGRRGIPLAELELIADECGLDLGAFLDDELRPLSQAQKDRRALARLAELSPEVREFVLNPTNDLYLRIAMRLSFLKADTLRQIAEVLLDITY